MQACPVLTRLIAHHFKLIEELDLEPGSATSALTGETGAGKSSLVQVLAAALGGKTAGNPLRPGTTQGEVQAWFDLTDCATVRNWLTAKDLPIPLDNSCILRRTFTADGRSRGQINGSAYPLSELATLGSMLVDMVAQNGHHSLLRTPAQTRLLDDSWSSALPLQQLESLHQQKTTLEKRLSELQQSRENSEQQRLFLEQQLSELPELPEEGEAGFAGLESEHKRLSASGDTLHALNSAEDQLQRQSGSVSEQLRQVLRQLPAANGDDDPINEISQRLEHASELVHEAAGSMSTLAEALAQSPERLATLEQLITSCHELARRHRCPPGELWERAQGWQQQLDEIENTGPLLQEIEQQLEQVNEQWQQHAEKVSATRHKTATALSQKVNELLHSLGMYKTGFHVEFLPARAASPGLEQVEFRYSPVAAVAPNLLANIASGGELSRLYLALCLSSRALSSGDGHNGSLPPLLVLDEADIGIGGKTAHRLAALIRQLGENRQVLCVTHLPQVAAAAQQHLKVAKTDEKVPRLTVEQLDKETRSQELARMLGGGRADKESRQLAEKLLQAAGQTPD